MQRRFCWIFIILASYITIYSISLAEAFTVSPGRIEVTLPAGEKYEGSYTVGNPSDTPIQVKVSVEEWFAGEEREAIRGEWPSLEWVKVTPQDLDLGPNGYATVNYTVFLPKEAKGVYVAMIYFGGVPGPSEGAIQVRGSIGNALYAIARGTEVIKGEIKDINAVNKDRLEIKVKIKNLGNIHIRPGGKIIVRKKGLILSKDDLEPIEIPFNEGEEPVFPKTECVISARSDVKIGPGRYGLEFNIEFGNEILRKELELSIDKDGGTQILDRDFDSSGRKQKHLKK
ncbi:MAG: hypothetical protein PHO42_02030 [Candidatus Omnitrophica bacterium]|nr:hypothetical protein [Candidatus Omnitrophota bacterium]